MPNIKQIQLPNGNTYDIKPDIAKRSGIFYGAVDSTSTATVFTASIDGITEYYDGLAILLKNGVVTSAANFTININGLGAKHSYNNMTAATADTTIFNVNYTMLFVYDSTRVSGGGWICYRGYDANTNTIGYQLRTNSTVMNVSDTARYYKIYFTSANGQNWVPASADSTNNATSARAVNQRPIDPFGRIVYTSANTNYAAGANLAATTIWDQYVLTLGYSFNRTGAALTLTTKRAVYIKCAPQTDGSAIIDSTTPYVQALPSTEDGKIYIFLGVATSATQIELFLHHPVYYYKDGAVRLWTNTVTQEADEALADTEVEAAFDAAFPEYIVTISLTNPIDGNYFEQCQIDELLSDHKDSVGNYDEFTHLGVISSADGNITVNVRSTSFGLSIMPEGSFGAAYYENNITTSGGATFVDFGTFGGDSVYQISGDGSIVIDGINYGD